MADKFNYCLHRFSLTGAIVAISIESAAVVEWHVEGSMVVGLVDKREPQPNPHNLLNFSHDTYNVECPAPCFLDSSWILLSLLTSCDILTSCFIFNTLSSYLLTCMLCLSPITIVLQILPMESCETPHRVSPPHEDINTSFLGLPARTPCIKLALMDHYDTPLYVPGIYQSSLQPWLDPHVDIWPSKQVVGRRSAIRG